MRGAADGEPDLCPAGILLPVLDERAWSRPLRASLYFAGMMYVFLGIAAIMEIFMTAVEAISSKKKKIYELRPDLPEFTKRKVWNATVANLTLMAVGCSAPEILLSIVETLWGGFEAGPLGPGSIVGSGALNILNLAFCITVVPRGHTRRILHWKVFLVTGFFNLMSHVWLYLILEVNSPGEVEVWEALVTLLTFPVFIFAGYATQKSCWTKHSSVICKLRGDEAEKEFAEACFKVDESISRANICLFVREVMKYPGMTLQDAALLAAVKMAETDRSSVWYRIGGARILTSGKPQRGKIKSKLKEVYLALTHEEHEISGMEIYSGWMQNQVFPSDTFTSTEQMMPGQDGVAVVEFESPMIAVTEAAIDFPVFLTRSGNLDNKASIRVTSVDGMAVQGEDFVPVNEVVEFQRGETRAQIMVRIIDENKYEPTEEFFLRLSTVPQENSVKLGKIRIMEIKIIQIKSPGLIEFEKRGAVIKENEGELEVVLVRKHGSDGLVSASWCTSDLTAKAGVDYMAAQGEVDFPHGVVKRVVILQIINTLSEEKDVRFEVVLSKPTGGAMLGSIRRMKIIITDDDDLFDIDNFIYMANINVDKLKIFKKNWCQQIKEAMLPNGGDVESATNRDYFLHFLFFFWKVLFSLIPPPTLLDGWVSLAFAIILAGLLATLAGDMAAIFGCCIGFHDTLTAITIVAIGTSITDAFACRFALINGKYADAAIGNINGSTAINVYLGFGFPWTLAAIYQKYQGNKFLVSPSTALGFVIGSYIISVFFTLILLFLRRKFEFFGKAEIGGPMVGRCISVMLLVCLWIFFVTISYLKIEGFFDAEPL